MKNWIKRHPILLLMLLVVGTPATLNYSGFCWAEKRWLSDEEKIEKVFPDYFLHPPETIVSYTEAGVLERKNPATRYKDIEQFHKENPNCCIIDNSKAADAGPPTFWDRIWGRYSDVIVIRYNPHHTDANGQHPGQSVAYVGNCGQGRW